MSKNSTFVVIVSAMIVSLSSFAGDTSKAAPAAAKQISFKELQDRCANPTSFDIQVAPANIVIRCMDVSHNWVAADSASVPFTATRHVVSEVVSSKFAVTSDAKDYPVAGDAGSCPRYKEVEQSFAIERSASCADIMNIKGDLEDFCAGSLEASKGVDAKLITTVDTGKVIDTCAGMAQEAGSQVINSDSKAAAEGKK